MPGPCGPRACAAWLLMVPHPNSHAGQHCGPLAQVQHASRLWPCTGWAQHAAPQHGEQPTIVAAYEDHRRSKCAGKVGCSMEVSLAGGALPEVCNSTGLLPVQLQAGSATQAAASAGLSAGKHQQGTLYLVRVADRELGGVSSACRQTQPPSPTQPPRQWSGAKLVHVCCQALSSAAQLL